VIVRPGVLGSRLESRETGRSLWPGSLFDLVTGRRFAALALPLDPEAARDVVPGAVFFEAFGRDYYGTIVRTLTEAGGDRCVPAGALTPEADCVLLAWDWRRDLVEAAAQVDEVIAELRRLRGDPALRVDLVAHSAGGLVARYFVRFGGRDVLDAAQPETLLDPAAAAAVRRVVLIGTPNYGSISTLQLAITGNDLGFGLATIPPEVMATMPSLFQLLPNPTRTWMIDSHGRRLEPDLFDPETWRRFGWSIHDPAVRARIRAQAGGGAAADAELARREAFFARALARAARFHRALSFRLATSASQYVVFGGDCALTPARCLLESVDGTVRIRLHPRDVRIRIPGVDYDALMLEPGDGRVTKASLLARDTLDPASPQPGFFPIAYAVFICRDHAGLPGDPTFRDNLLNVLLYQERGGQPRRRGRWYRAPHRARKERPVDPASGLPATLNEAIATEPLWLQAWVGLLVVTHLTALLFAAGRREGRFFVRPEAVAILVSFVAAGVFMGWLYERVGYVRLLGLAHLLFWGPVWLWLLLRRRAIGTDSLFGKYLLVYLAVAGASLGIDAIDVVRHLAGDGELLHRWS
jgi:hypothetical protein